MGFEASEFALARWISCPDKNRLADFIAAHRSAIAEDVDGDPICLFRSAFYVDYTTQQWPGVAFTDVKDPHAKQ